MADQLYLSLWFPNFRLEALPAALVSVMRQFALISSASLPGGYPEGKRVAAASAYPIAFSEAPTFQRLYVNDGRAEQNGDTSASIIETAVSEATEQLHEDMAYEFEMKWNLWTPDSGPGSPSYAAGSQVSDASEAHLDVLWKPTPATVKIIGLAPLFDDSSFEQNGHVRIDFGLDYPWVLDDPCVLDDEEELDLADPHDLGKPAALAELDDIADPDGLGNSAAGTGARQAGILPFQNSRSTPPAADPSEARLGEAAGYIQKNVEMLLAFTLSVEKHCGISSRLLWTESGEPLAEKLIARLQRLN